MEKVFLNSLIDFADWYKKSNLFIKKEKSYLHNCNTSNWNNVFILITVMVKLQTHDHNRISLSLNSGLFPRQ